MPTAPDCADFDFSLGAEGSFGPCSPQLERSPRPHLPPHLPPQRLPSPPRWWDAAGTHQRALGDALKANSQLQETLAQRQQELVALRESNAQLKELASQARQLAAVLETLMLPQDANREALRPPPLPPPQPPAAEGVPAGACGGVGRPEPPCVDAMLREVSERCRAALQSLGGGPGGSPGGSPSAKRPRAAPRLHGAFRGERSGRADPAPSEPEGGGVLRAALGEPGGIRTLAFPQGSAFTLRTGDGYRFRWVPR
ncbi:multicilin [Phaenicophaeus curvirostris]|uniref:multicilin n=1 Tax=Phaenicophaeus curvirostris TaxID=33595 RepID=UPI0037F10076